MPILESQSAIALTVMASCPNCRSGGEGVLTVPLASRELASFERACDMITGGERACPSCGHPSLTVDRIVYAWDEPDLPPLEFTAAEGLICAGRPVISEADLVDAVGRPFSLAAYHRLRLTAVDAPMAYSPSPHVAVLAMPAELADADADALRAQLRGLFADSATPLGDGQLVTVPWSTVAATGGPAVWLGPQAEAVRHDRLRVVSMVAAGQLTDELDRACGERDLTLRFDHAGAALIGMVAAPSAMSVTGTPQLRVSPAEVAERTVREPMTLREACVITAEEAKRRLDAAQSGVARAASVTAVNWGEDLQATVTVASGRTERVEMSQLTRRYGYDPEYLASGLDLLLAGPDGPVGQQRPCGCTPVLTMVVRSEEWLFDARDAGPTPLFTPLRDGLYGVLVEDCPHMVRTLAEDDMQLEDALEQANASVGRLRFDTQQREVRGVDGSLAAVIACGHNLASVVWHAQLLRGLAATTRLDSDRVGAVLFTSDLLCLVSPSADMEMIALSVARAQEDLRQQSLQLPQLPMRGVFTFGSAGARAGQFSVSDF